MLIIHIQRGKLLIGVNRISIYIVVLMCLCNLNARFMPIVLKIALIPHLLIFCRIRRKIKHGKGKNLRRKNMMFEALVRCSKEVCQGELSFAVMKEGRDQKTLSGTPR